MYDQSRFPLILFALPVLFTVVGGLTALRLRRHLPILIAIGAGLLLGASFLDLLPEAVDLGRSTGFTTTDVLGWMLLAFFLFHGLEALLDQAAARAGQTQPSRRVLGRSGASLLIFHSFRDGLAIGATYAVSHTAGYAIALGIAAHDLGDGMNTVILSTGGEPPTRSDYLFLAADALAPFFGALLTSWWVLSPRASVLMLAVAAGFFLQMATGGFLPQLRHAEGAHGSLLAAVFGGALMIYLAKMVVGHPF